MSTVERTLDDPAPDPERGEPSDALVGISRGRRYIPEAESVRGIAVVLVAAFHLDNVVRFFTPPPAPTLINAWMLAGHTGVDLFFLLSGFLLSLPFLAEGLGGRRVSVTTYARRRALRILPLYYVAVVVGAALDAPGGLRDGLPYLFFLNGFSGRPEPLGYFSGVWWSLATEVQFYVVLPLLLLLRTSRGRVLGAALMLAYGVAYVAMVRGSLHAGSIPGQMALLHSVVGRGPLFLWGIFAAVVYHVWGPTLRTRLAATGWLRLGGADLLLAATLLVEAGLLRWTVSIGARWMSTQDQPWHIMNGALWAAFLLLLLLFPLASKGLFSNRVLARLGIVSYSIYLIHLPFFAYSLSFARFLLADDERLYRWTTLSLGVAALLCAALYVFSEVSFRFIERPFLLYKRRLG
jgi:peptidoglycan/LPS O-acetylase OafA/YrhL